MKDLNSNTRFKELLEDLSNGSVTKTSDGKINIHGNIISSQDFDSLYLADIKSLFSSFETSISPEYKPSKDVFNTLNIFSNPVLKSTGVPEVTKAFTKKISMAIIDENYGKKFSGKQVIEMAEEGLVDSEQVISMLKYKSLYAQDNQSPNYVEPVSCMDLLNFYSPEKHPGRMLGLQAEGKLTLEFQEFHKEMLAGVPKKEKNEYIEDLISEARENASTSQEFSGTVLQYANNQIIPDSNLEQNVSGEFLKSEYIAGHISLARLLDIYKTNPKYYQAVETILTPEEITSAHKKDKVNDDALMLVPKESRIEYLRKNNARFSTMMYLFLHQDGFSISELSSMLSDTNNTENLEYYIDQGSKPEKIKELFEEYLIDYACIKHLQESGILTERDMQKYHFKINKPRFYQELESSRTVTIIGNGNAVPFTSTGTFIEKEHSVPPETLDVFKILGRKNDTNFASLPTISHKDNNGKSSFLDDYRIIPLEFSGLVALVSNDKQKPIYIMPYQEAAYIINSHKLPENFSENEEIKEIRPTEKMPEQILKTANQIEEAQPYLERTGYNEELDFASNFEIMIEQYEKIKIKGEN